MSQASHDVAAGYDEVHRELERQRTEAARRATENQETIVDVPVIVLEIQRPQVVVVKPDNGTAV
jgi:hypothetical protein